jgi:hypothetical protein
MKRQIFTLFTVLTLTAFGALMAQTPSNSTLPPSQQVDQSGKPEAGPGPDVDVDAGHNAANGVLDVQVNKQTDPDTSARDTTTATGTTNGTTTSGTMAPDTTTNGTMTHDTTTNGTLTNSTTTSTTTDTTATNGTGANRNLPGTASDLPLFALIGFSALAGAAALRLSRRDA